MTLHPLTQIGWTLMLLVIGVNLLGVEPAKTSAMDRAFFAIGIVAAFIGLVQSFGEGPPT